MKGANTFTTGNRLGATTCDCPSSFFATEAKAAYAGFLVPPAVSSPLCQVPGLSRIVNQMNISTNGLAAAICRAVFASLACRAYVTPAANCGFVCSPYSVIQIGTRRWNHFCSD